MGDDFAGVGETILNLPQQLIPFSFCSYFSFVVEHFHTLPLPWFAAPLCDRRGNARSKS
jgi:hypothetical protein